LYEGLYNEHVKIIWEDKNAPWNNGLKISEQSRSFIKGFLSGYSDTINPLHAYGNKSMDNTEFTQGYNHGKRYAKLGGEHIVQSMVEK